MLEKVASFITTHRGRLSAFLLLLLVVMGLLTKLPEFDGSFNGFILNNNPYYATAHKIDSVFNIGKPVYVKIRPADTNCITVLAGLKHLEREISAAAPECNILSIRRVITGFIPPEQYNAPISSVISTISGFPLFKDLVSNDKKSFLLILNVERDSLFSKERFDRVLTQKYEGISSLKAISLFHIETSVSGSIRQDVIVLSSLIGLFFAVYIYFVYRSFRAILFAIAIIGAAVFSSLFFFSLLGYKLNMITTLAIPVLVVISLSDVVHLLSGYAHLKDSYDTTEIRIKEVVKLYMVPSFISSATTSAAFLSFFIFNETTFIRQFGLVTAIIVQFEFFITFLLAPYLLQFIHLKRAAPVSLTGITRFLERHQKTFTVVFVLFMAASFGLLGSLKYNTDLEMFYPIGSKIESLHREFRKDFYSSNGADILVEPLASGVVMPDSSVKAAVSAITRKIEARRDVISVNSAGKDYYIPTATGIPINLLDFAGRNNPFVSPDRQYFRIQLMFKAEDDVIAFNRDFEQFIEPWSKDFRISFTSPGVIVKAIDASTSSSLFSALFLSGLFIAVILFLFTRSILLTLVSLIPNMIPLSMVIYMFYFGGLNINILTAISAVICLGLLDDDTVHILYRKLIKQQPLEEVSVSILSTSILLSGGFSMFVFSSFTPTRVFGVICAAVFFVGVISEITATAYLTGLLKTWIDSRKKKKLPPFDQP